MKWEVIVLASIFLFIYYTMPLPNGETPDGWTSRMFNDVKRFLARRNKRKARGIRRVPRRDRARGP